MKLPRGPTLLVSIFVLASLAIVSVFIFLGVATAHADSPAGSVITIRFSEATANVGDTTIVTVMVVDEKGWVVSEQTLDLERNGSQLTLLLDGASIDVSTRVDKVNPLKLEEQLVAHETTRILEATSSNPTRLRAVNPSEVFEEIVVQGGPVASLAPSADTCVPCHR